MKSSSLVLRLTGAAVLAAAAILPAQDPAGAGAAAGEQVHLEEEYSAPYLERAKAEAAAGHWKAAIEIYAFVVGKYPHEVTAVEAGPLNASRAYVSVLDHVAARIAAFPPEALALYRREADPAAEAQFAAAASAGDLAGLRRIADLHLLTSVGDDASDLLAARLLEAGRADEAAYYGSRLLRLVPDPSVSRAAVAARLALAIRRSGRAPEAEEREALTARDRKSVV